jgi:type II secretory pathway component HofQ
MDGRKPAISLSNADAVPTDSVRNSSSVIYFGSTQQISEGFAVALRAMGFEAGILSSDLAQSDTTSNPEDS